MIRGVAQAPSGTGHSDGLYLAPWTTIGSGVTTFTSSNSADDAVTIFGTGSRDGFVSHGMIYNNSASGGLFLQFDSMYLNVSKLDFRSAGALQIRPAGDSFKKDLSVNNDITVSSTTKLLEVGSATNTRPIVVPASAAKTIAGDMTFRTSSFTNSSALTSTGSSGHIKIISDAVELAANLATAKPGGVVTIAPRSNATRSRAPDRNR